MTLLKRRNIFDTIFTLSRNKDLNNYYTLFYGSYTINSN